MAAFQAVIPKAGRPLSSPFRRFRLRPIADIDQAIYHPQMLTFTPLEKSVLDTICMMERPSMPRLREVLSTGVVTSRENTGHGFYTRFLTTARKDDHWTPMIDGPYARMLDMGEGALMCFFLWCAEQGPTTLEGFQLGNAGASVDLKARDLGTLRFSEVAY
jgi:hypothetical protein